jgi:hypothetical protein
MSSACGAPALKTIRPLADKLDDGKAADGEADAAAEAAGFEADG